MVSAVNGRVVHTPFDISGDEIKLAVVDLQTGEVVFQKSSTVPAEITIRAPQTGADLGKANIHFVAADTESMDPDGCYGIEVWALLAASGDQDAVIDCSPFNVVERKLPVI